MVEVNNEKLMDSFNKVLNILEERASYVIEGMDDVSHEVVNEEMALICVNFEPKLIENIPVEFITQRVVDKLLKYENFYLDEIFAYIPYEFFTQEIVDRMLEKDLNYIRFIPEIFITFDLLKETPASIKYIPEKFITEEMVKYILEKDILYVKYIPEKFITKEMLSSLK